MSRPHEHDFGGHRNLDRCLDCGELRHADGQLAVAADGPGGRPTIIAIPKPPTKKEGP